MDRQELLGGVYMFRHATPDDLAAVLAIAEPRSHLPGDTIYRKGERATELFVIELGTVDIGLPDRDVPITTVGSGQAFGEVAFFDREERIAQARTREVTRLLRIPYDGLDALFADRPLLAVSFYRSTCAFLTRHLRRLALDLNVDMNRRFL